MVGEIVSSGAHCSFRLSSVMRFSSFATAKVFSCPRKSPPNRPAARRAIKSWSQGSKSDAFLEDAW